MEVYSARMHTPFLTIAEAVEKTNRSPSTIRRLIRTITDAASHVDREGILPTSTEVEVLKKKGENFTWKIQEEVLFKHMKGALKEDKKSEPESKKDILQILHRELEIKNGQIEKQWEVIHSLNDRLREGNMLMGALQKRLTLPSSEGANASAVDAVPVMAAKEAAHAPSKKASATDAATSAKKASKKGLFAWLKR